MRVIIMEINGKEAVALGRDGRFIRIRNAAYTVGQEIVIVPEMIIRKENVNRTRTVTRIAAVAACFCILFASIFGLVILNSQSYGYVSVDVNPSIEYRINRRDRVVSVSATNEDGEALLAAIGVENMEDQDIEIALSLTVNELSVQGYLDGEDAGVIISSSASTKKASAALSEKLLAYTQAEEKLKDVEVITAMVSRKLIREAEKLGTTAGKLHLIKSISEDVDIEEWIDKSVTEIYAAVQEHSSELPTDPETNIEPPPEVTVEPETLVGTDEENATSESNPDTDVEPDVTTEAGEVSTETETETESATETETEEETETDTETETESETEKETERETETEVPAETETTDEDKTWPETWPETMPEEWPEEWPDPETDDSGNVIMPEPEKKPWWWWLWELIFGWH